ncbi:MAG TPA: hypothetical protein VK707_04660 [Solirubrobacteraceae bacterium]|jgi:hypothetical protein|nr:hypothetical protein [Solirubrobacteraceae bacterium]
MHLLILDDAKTTDLTAMARAARALGHEVSCAVDPDQFLHVAREHRDEIEGYIVDYSVPGSRAIPGLKDGPDVVALDAAESFAIPTMFLTNYPPDCDRRLGDCDPRLITTVVEKPTSGSREAWAETIRDGIDNLRALGERQRSESLGVEVSKLESEFFRMAPRDLDALDDVSREELEARTAHEIHESLGSLWHACDDDWLMLQAADGVTFVTSRGFDDALPTIDDVRAIEAERESPALVIGRPSLIEETPGLVDCSPSKYKDWRKYPFVKLIVGSEEREFHLDTGSATSYISREFLQAHVPMPEVKAKSTTLADLGGRAETISEVPIDVSLHVAGPSGNIALSLRLQAIRNWQGVMLLNPPCHRGQCPNSIKPQCGRRLGLIGRDTLYSLESGIWQLDPATGQFYAVVHS